MCNIICGIDFSMNAPAISIQKENLIKVYSILNRNLPICKKLTEEEKKFVLFHVKQENVLQDIDFLTDNILNILLHNYVNKVFIEGFSFMSKGAYYIQLIEYQSVLRHKLYKSGIEIEIVSPKTVKKAAGKGNLDKVGMFEEFLKLDPQKYIFENDFLNLCKNNKELIYHKVKDSKTKLVNIKGINKPYEDIIDSFYCLKCSELIK